MNVMLLSQRNVPFEEVHKRASFDEFQLVHPVDAPDLTNHCLLNVD